MSSPASVTEYSITSSASSLVPVPWRLLIKDFMHISEMDANRMESLSHTKLMQNRSKMSFYYLQLPS
jgi:hypothetical protein